MAKTRTGRASKGQGILARMLCRVERRCLGLGMRGIAAFADRQMSRYNARELAAADEGARPPA